MPSILYNGFEFKDEETFSLYKKLQIRFMVASSVSVFTLLPALLLFVLSLGSSSSYVFLIPLAVGVVFSVFSYRANSRLTELLNSDEARHLG
jgi:hypothetical protein